jgi:hypothetical protein
MLPRVFSGTRFHPTVILPGRLIRDPTVENVLFFQADGQRLTVVNQEKCTSPTMEISKVGPTTKDGFGSGGGSQGRLIGSRLGLDQIYKKGLRGSSEFAASSCVCLEAFSAGIGGIFWGEVAKGNL